MTKLLPANRQANPDQVDTLLSYAQLLREVGSDAGAGPGRGEGGLGAGIHCAVLYREMSKEFFDDKVYGSGMECKRAQGKGQKGLRLPPWMTVNVSADIAADLRQPSASQGVEECAVHYPCATCVRNLIRLICASSHCASGGMQVRGEHARANQLLRRAAALQVSMSADGRAPR